MPIYFQCSQCFAHVTADDSKAGAVEVCQACGRETSVPTGSTVSEPKIPSIDEKTTPMVSNYRCSQCFAPITAPDSGVGAVGACQVCGRENLTPIGSKKTTEQSVDPDREKRCPMCSEMIKATAKKCRFCGELLSEDLNESTVQTASPGGYWGKSILGIVFVCLGVLVVGFGLTSDTTVISSNFDRVHNIGLMNDRTVGIMIGIGLLITGAIVIKK
ncbi:MAG: hypothetical protein WA705_00865 [Candidatus Ozemobacteraceae bacterium]